MSITVAFLAPHTGRHAAAAVAWLSPAWASRFLRAFRPSPPEGGRADPAPPRGAALLQDEPAEHWFVPSEQLSDAELAELDARIDAALRRPVNGRLLGTQPRQYLPASTLDRRKPIANRQPWQTMQQPALVEPEPAPALDPGDGLGAPVALARPYVAEAQEDAYPCCAHCAGFTCDRPYHPTPCDEGCNGVVDGWGEVSRD